MRKISLVLLCCVALSTTAKPKRHPATIDVTSQKGSNTAANVIGVFAVGIPLGGNQKAFAILTVDQNKWLVEMKGDSSDPKLKAGHYNVETDEQPGKKLVAKWDVIIIEEKKP